MYIKDKPVDTAPGKAGNEGEEGDNHDDSIISNPDPYFPPIVSLPEVQVNTGTLSLLFKLWVGSIGVWGADFLRPCAPDENSYAPDDKKNPRHTPLFDPSHFTLQIWIFWKRIALKKFKKISDNRIQPPNFLQ